MVISLTKNTYLVYKSRLHLGDNKMKKIGTVLLVMIMSVLMMVLLSYTASADRYVNQFPKSYRGIYTNDDIDSTIKITAKQIKVGWFSYVKGKYHWTHTYTVKVVKGGSFYAGIVSLRLVYYFGHLVKLPKADLGKPAYGVSVTKKGHSTQPYYRLANGDINRYIYDHGMKKE